jgi:hypothetical protein
MQVSRCSPSHTAPDSRSQFRSLCIATVLFAVLFASAEANSWQGPPQGLGPPETAPPEVGNASIDNSAAEEGIAKKLHVAYVLPGEEEHLLGEPLSAQSDDHGVLAKAPELADPQKCVPTLSAGDARVSQAGGSIKVRISAGENCAWKASAGIINWLMVSSGEEGNGSGAVNFTIFPNTNGSPRTAAVTIAGQIFVLTQAGVQAQLLSLHRSLK